MCKGARKPAKQTARGHTSVGLSVNSPLGERSLWCGARAEHMTLASAPGELATRRIRSIAQQSSYQTTPPHTTQTYLRLMPLEGEDLVEVVGIPVFDGLVLGAGEQVVRPANKPNALHVRGFFCILYFCVQTTCSRSPRIRGARGHRDQ